MEYPVDEIKCKKCLLWETSCSGEIRRSGFYGRGSGRNGLWFYGEAYGANEIIHGMPFVGDAGKILSSILLDVGIEEHDCFITNVVRCRPPANRTPSVAEMRSCMDAHSKLDVPKYPPKLVVLLGTVPLKAVLNKQKIGDNRGILFDCEMFGCKALSTYHPAAILRRKNTDLYHTLKADIIKAKEYVYDIKEDSKPKHTSVLINSKKDFVSCMNILTSKDIVDRVCDIETDGLDFFRNKIISISFTFEHEGEVFSISFLTTERQDWWHADLQDPEVHELLQKVLRFPIDFQNGLFDVKFFWYNKFYVNFGVDTMDQHLMIDEDSPHNLHYLVTRYNKENVSYKQEALALAGEEGGHHNLPTEFLLEYNNNDTFNTYLLKKKFSYMIKSEGVEDFFNKLAMPLKRVLTRMSYRGIMMDRQGIMDKSDEYRKKIKEKETELWDSAGQKFNYSASSKEIQTVLYNKIGLPIVKRTDKGNPSTDKEVLAQLSRLHPVPSLITELRRYKYFLRLYLDGNDLSEEVDPSLGMLNRLDENDRIHGPFLSGGTISGRPSCPKPNLLNISKFSEIRNLFIAPPNWKIIEIDYSQAELVLLAYLSGDKQFMHDVMESDFHMATAKSLMKMDEVDDITRRYAKNINFLKSYGGGKAKLAGRLKEQEEERYFKDFNEVQKYIVKCKNTNAYHHNARNPIPIEYETVNKTRKQCYLCEADDWLKKWDETYPDVPVYKQYMARLWRQDGQITGLYGRKKRFPPVFNREQESYYDRVAVNFMCQNGVSETLNRSMVDIDYLLEKLFGWTPEKMYSVPGLILGAYDSAMCEAPDELVETVKEIMVECMSIPVEGIDISLKYDINVSQKWGEKLTEVQDIEEEGGGDDR